MSTAPTDPRKTAAAETSFATFAFGCISGLTRSVIFSMEVLKSSRINTKMIVSNKITNSRGVKARRIATTRAIKAATVWNLKFGSLANASLMPFIANSKLPAMLYFLLILFRVYYHV